MFTTRHELALLRVSTLTGLIMFGGMSTLFYTQMTGILSVSNSHRQLLGTFVFLNPDKTFLKKNKTRVWSNTTLIRCCEKKIGADRLANRINVCIIFCSLFSAGYNNHWENGPFLQWNVSVLNKTIKLVVKNELRLRLFALKVKPSNFNGASYSPTVLGPSGPGSGR